jgi:hypothetical protein
MTDTEWMAGTDPIPMLQALWDRVSERKCRRLYLAICSDSSQKLCAVGRRAFEIADRFADGYAPETLRRWAEKAIKNAKSRNDGWFPHGVISLALRQPGDRTSSLNYMMAVTAADLIGELLVAPDLFVRTIRDIFVNPFRPVAINPAWLTSTALALAQGIYDDRAFDRLPILADALQDAGCENNDILAHCRSVGPHVRGCWVVDLVLGKS